MNQLNTRNAPNEDEVIGTLATANPVQPDEFTSHSGRERLYRTIIDNGRTAVRSSPRRRNAFAGGGAAAALAGGVMAVVILSGGGGDGAGLAVVNPGDAAGGGSFASCLAFSPAELRLRQFAFVGTVTGIDGPKVTFAIDEALAGALGESVVIELDSTLQNDMYTDFAIEIGERYLVSGDEGLAWGCGFTQPFSEVAAGEWRAALQ